MLPGKIGRLLVDHGSRRAASNLQLEDMAARVAARRPGLPVAAVHMEIAPPCINDGVDRLVAQGATEIVALLYFLSDGRHSQEDVPHLLAEAVARHPGVTGRCGAALGPHDKLADLLLERADC
jgi:sirohydrochlorin ferrochelatase